VTKQKLGQARAREMWAGTMKALEKEEVPLELRAVPLRKSLKPQEAQSSPQGPPDASITLSIRKDVRAGIPCIEGTKSTLDEILAILNNMGPGQEIGMWYTKGHPLTYKPNLELLEEVVDVLWHTTWEAMMKHMGHVARLGWRKRDWMKGQKEVSHET
jgi:hypothetical protein